LSGGKSWFLHPQRVPLGGRLVMGEFQDRRRRLHSRRVAGNALHPPTWVFLYTKEASQKRFIPLMALYKAHSAAVYGIDAHLIDVEVDLYPSGTARDFFMVGMPDTAVRESR